MTKLESKNDEQIERWFGCGSANNGPATAPYRPTKVDGFYDACRSCPIAVFVDSARSVAR